MKHESMQMKDFIAIVENALKDEFIAKITRKENEIRLQLLNGQTFKVKVEEV